VKLLLNMKFTKISSSEKNINITSKNVKDNRRYLSSNAKRKLRYYTRVSISAFWKLMKFSINRILYGLNNIAIQFKNKLHLYTYLQFLGN